MCMRAHVYVCNIDLKAHVRDYKNGFNHKAAFKKKKNP